MQDVDIKTSCVCLYRYKFLIILNNKIYYLKNYDISGLKKNGIVQFYYFIL